MFAPLSEINFSLFVTILAISLAFSFVLLRKKIWNIFDPMIFILFNVAVNYTIVCYYFFCDRCELGFFVFVSLCYLAFLFGLAINLNHNIREGAPMPSLRGPSKTVTVYLIFVSIFLQLVSTVFMFTLFGFGALSGDVDHSVVKITMTQGGFGLISYLSSAGGMMFLPLVAHAYFAHRMKALSFFCMIYFLVTSILFSFSKTGFLFIMFSFGILLHFYKIAINKVVISYRYIIIAGLIGLIPAFFVIHFILLRTGESFLTLVLTRFIATAGGTYGYFILGGVNAFDGISYAQKLAYYFDTILSIFRFKAWEMFSYSAYMQKYLFGSATPGFGANPYLFFDGHFLFGWFGIIYCFLIGLILNYVRSLRVNIVLYFMLITITLSIYADTAITQDRFFSALLLIPFWLFIYFAVKAVNSNLMVPIIKYFKK